MTLAVRNTVLILGSTLALLLLLLYGIVGFQILLGGQSPAVAPEWHHAWLAWTWQVRGADVGASLVAVGIVGLASVVGLVGASRVFRRINSAELYFFALFLVGLSVEQLRLVQLYLFQLDLPAVYGAILTRLVIVARIGGSFALFTASLYAVGIDYPRIGSVTIALGLLAFSFVYFVPVDTVTVNATMLHQIAGQASLELALLAVGVMTIINYIIAGARGHRERGFFIALAAVSIVTAQQMLSSVPSLAVSIAGVVLLVYGLLTFVLISRAHVLWY